MVKIKPLIEKYIASLPNLHRKENWKDIGVNPPKGKIEKIVKKGIEKKGQVGLIITGDFQFNRENRFMMNALSSLLSDKLREEIREEKSGTYGIMAMGNPEKYPKQRYTYRIMFGCDPTRAEELIDDVMKVIEKVKTTLPDEKDMKKIKETFKREYEVNMKKNSVWVSWLNSYYWNNEDPNKIIEYTQLIDNLKPEDLKEAANKYLVFDNFAKFILYPEK